MKLYRLTRAVLAGSAFTVVLAFIGWHLLAFRVAHVDRLNLADTIAAEKKRKESNEHVPDSRVL